MTEYDFSQEAADRHLRKQYDISKWVRQTHEEGPLRNPYTPATPAVREQDLDDVRIHHRGQSQHDRHRDRDFDRHGDKGYDQAKPRSVHHSTRPRRHRSSSQSATLQSVPRSYEVPPPLPLPPQSWHIPYSQKPSPVASTLHPQHYPPKLTSPRDSRHSSHSSSTTRIHSPNSYFPPQPSPINYNHSPDTNYGYSQPAPLRDGRVPDFTNAPQYPHSAYQVKQPPTLFKRLLKGLTGGNKQESRRVPRRKRSSSF